VWARQSFPLLGVYISLAHASMFVSAGSEGKMRGGGEGGREPEGSGKTRGEREKL
jgi:hypothetical protein